VSGAWRVRGLRLGGLFLTVLLWELLGRSDPVLRDVLPPFTSVLAALGDVLRSPRLGANATTTGYEISVGFGIGAALGLAAGLLVAASAFWHRVFEPFLYYLGAIPKIVLYPVLILLLGAGASSKVGIAAASAFFPVAISAAVAARQVDPRLVRAARVLGARRAQILLKVYLPATAGPLLSGLRLGLAVAITGVLLAETSVAQAGLGVQAIGYYEQLEIARLYALLLLIFLVVTLLNEGLSRLIERLTAYHRTAARMPVA